jgi:hypothetical protein
MSPPAFHNSICIPVFPDLTDEGWMFTASGDSGYMYIISKWIAWDTIHVP